MAIFEIYKLIYLYGGVMEEAELKKIQKQARIFAVFVFFFVYFIGLGILNSQPVIAKQAVHTQSLYEKIITKSQSFLPAVANSSKNSTKHAKTTEYNLKNSLPIVEEALKESPIPKVAVKSVTNPYLSLSDCSIYPTSVNPGGSFTMTYKVYNPNSNSISVALGASIASQGTQNWINDTSTSDFMRTLYNTNGWNYVSRTFVIASNIAAGNYDVAFGVWGGTPGGNGIPKYDGGTRSGILTINKVNHAPSKPLLISPSNNATNIDTKPTLSWYSSSDSDGDSVKYKIYFGTVSDPPFVDTTFWGTTSWSRDTLQNNTTYYWKVVTVDSNGAVSEPSAVWQFKTKNINHNPTLSNIGVSPISGTTNDTYIFQATYQDQDGDWPSYIQAQIDGSGGNYAHNMTLYSGTPGAGAIYRYSTSLAAGNHNFFITTGDGQGGSSYTDLVYNPNVTNSNVYPQVSNLTINQGSGYNDTSFTFSVKYQDLNNDAPTKFKLIIDGIYYHDMSNGLFGNTPYYWAGVTYTKTLSGFSRGNHYYNVLFNDGQAGHSDVTISSPQGFTVLNRLPSQPSNPSPTDGAIDTDTNLTVSWNASTDLDKDSVSYDIYRGTAQNILSLLGNTANNSFNFSGLGSDTTYFWQVVAKDSYGGTTASPIWQFKTKKAPLEIIQVKVTDDNGNEKITFAPGDKIGFHIYTNSGQNSITTKYEVLDPANNIVSVFSKTEMITNQPTQTHFNWISTVISNLADGSYKFRGTIQSSVKEINFTIKKPVPIIDFNITDQADSAIKKISGRAQAITYAFNYIHHIEILIDGQLKYTYINPYLNLAITMPNDLSFDWNWTATSNEILSGNHTITIRAYDANNGISESSKSSSFTVVKDFSIPDITGNFGETAIGGYVYVTPGNNVPPDCGNNSPGVTSCNNGLATITLFNSGNVDTKYKIINKNNKFNIKLLNPNTLNYADNALEVSINRNQSKNINLSISVPSSIEPDQLIDVPIEISYDGQSSVIHIVYFVTDTDFYAQYCRDQSIKSLQNIADFMIDIVFAKDSVGKEIEEYNKLSDTNASSLDKIFNVALNHPLESADIALSWTFVGALVKDGSKIGIKSLITSNKLGGEIVFKEFAVKNVDEILVRNAQENTLSTVKKETLENIQKYGADWLVKDTLRESGDEATKKFLTTYGALFDTVGGVENINLLGALVKNSHYNEVGVRSVIREFSKISDISSSKELFKVLTQQSVGSITQAEKFYKQLRYTTDIAEQLGREEAIKVMTIEHEVADVLIAKNNKFDFQQVKSYVVPSNLDTVEAVAGDSIGKQVFRAKQYFQANNIFDKSQLTLVVEGFESPAAKQAIIDYAKQQGFRYFDKGEITVVATGQDLLKFNLLGFVYFESPKISTNSGLDFKTDNQNVFLSGTCNSATSSIWVDNSQDGVTYTPGSTNWSFSKIMEKGSHTFYILSKDDLGNESPITAITILIDPPPVINNNNGQNFSTNNSNLVLTGTAETFFNQVLINGSTNGVIYNQSTGEWSYSKTLVEGANHFVVTAKTSTGVESDPTSIIIALDTQAPLAAANHIGGAYDQPQNVTLFSNDSEAKIYFTLDGSSPTIQSSQYSDPITIDKNTTLKFFAIDPAGNQSEIKTETYKISSTENITLNLSRGWNMISVPSEFSDLTQFRATPYIWRYDNNSGQYIKVTDKLLPGEGYFVWCDIAKSITIAAPVFDEKNYTTLNYQSGWAMISSDWLKYADQIKIYRNGQKITLNDIISQKIIVSAFVYSNNHYESIDLANINISTIDGQAIWVNIANPMTLSFSDVKAENLPTNIDSDSTVSKNIPTMP